MQPSASGLGAHLQGKPASIEGFKIRKESLMALGNLTMARCPCKMQGSMGTGAFIEAARQHVQSVGMKIALELFWGYCHCPASGTTALPLLSVYTVVHLTRGFCLTHCCVLVTLVGLPFTQST